MIVGNEKTIRFGQFFDTKCRRRDVSAHDTIQNAIGLQLQNLGFEVIYEWTDKDEDSSYRFDIIAQKGKELWVIEVKDMIDIRNFGQLEAYCLQVKKENPNSKVWLGTDCKNYWDLITGEVGQMTERLMKQHKMGVILINPHLYWILPTHNELLNVEERGHLCEDCKYCDGLTVNGVARNFLIAVEQGLKKMPRINESDRGTIYEYTVKNFKDIKKEFIEIKKKIGKKEFEATTGLKLES